MLSAMPVVTFINRLNHTGLLQGHSGEKGIELKKTVNPCTVFLNCILIRLPEVPSLEDVIFYKQNMARIASFILISYLLRKFFHNRKSQLHKIRIPLNLEIFEVTSGSKPNFFH